MDQCWEKYGIPQNVSPPALNLKRHCYKSTSSLFTQCCGIIGVHTIRWWHSQTIMVSVTDTPWEHYWLSHRYACYANSRWFVTLLALSFCCELLGHMRKLFDKYAAARGNLPGYWQNLAMLTNSGILNMLITWTAQPDTKGKNRPAYRQLSFHTHVRWMETQEPCLASYWFWGPSQMSSADGAVRGSVSTAYYRGNMKNIDFKGLITKH